jgi:hypothetical protein
MLLTANKTSAKTTNPIRMVARFPYKNSSTLLHLSLQYFCQGTSTAGMAPYDLNIRTPGFIHRALDHFVGYRIGKKYQKIRFSNLLIHTGSHLSENLRFTLIIFTDLFILTDHTVMPSYDYDAHTLCSFPYLSLD